jgi:hypothetical protein
MPQVPYNPVPSVRPGGGATPQINISTGNWGAVGQALQHLGSTVEASGNELFTRAMAIQQLRNETEVTEAIAKQELGSGQLHTNYSALQGRTAVDGFDTYQKDQDKLRTDVRATLSNPAAQRMYDRASLGIMNRNIFNGAGHAAAQQRIWTRDAASARVDSAIHQAGISPEDNAAYDEQIKNITSAVTQQSENDGWDQDKFNDVLARAKSGALANRIEKLSRINPSSINTYSDEVVNIAKNSHESANLLDLDS